MATIAGIVKIHTRLIKANRRTMEEVPETYRVPVYVQLVLTEYITIDDVPEEYREDVRAQVEDNN